MSAERIVYQGKYLKLTEKMIGNDLYELAHLRPAVIIFAKNSDGKFLFIKEVRPHESPSLRLKPVTGFIDDGDDWLTTVKRELREEVGLVAQNFELFQHMPITSSIVTDKYFVIATELSNDPNPLTNPDDDVVREKLYLSLDEAIALTTSGEMTLTTDSLGLFLLREKKL